MVKVTNCDNNVVKPRLPNNYKENCWVPYTHNGYLFNLEPGRYTISVAFKKVVDGSKWLIRTVSPHAALCGSTVRV